MGSFERYLGGGVVSSHIRILITPLEYNFNYLLTGIFILFISDRKNITPSAACFEYQVFRTSFQNHFLIFASSAWAGLEHHSWYELRLPAEKGAPIPSVWIPSSRPRIPTQQHNHFLRFADKVLPNSQVSRISTIDRLNIRINTPQLLC
jgi:hypothetical protein